MPLSLLTPADARALGISWPDVYFSPGWGEACEVSDGAPWELAYDPAGPIVYPYLKRPVPSALPGSDGRWDAVSPYGYAGTWCPVELPVERLAAFREELRQVWAAAGCVAEFQRMSGLVGDPTRVLAADAGLTGRHLADTVVIPLSAGADAAFAAYEGRARTKVRKAAKLGYTWSIRPTTPEDLTPDAPFPVLYRRTMELAEAKPWYFFPDAYFQRLHDGLDGGLRLLEVRDAEGVVRSAGLVLVPDPRSENGLLHLHLTGSDRDALRDGAGNLLYDGLIRWGCANGFARLHIGGGLTKDDALFYFKQSFGGERVPFWIASAVIDPAAYEALTAARAAQTERAPEALTGFFPAYRA